MKEKWDKNVFSLPSELSSMMQQKEMITLDVDWSQMLHHVLLDGCST
jgi:hypothetical protein